VCVCMWCAECIVECVDEVIHQDIDEELVESNCGLHMSCTSSFANFAPYNEQADHGMSCFGLFDTSAFITVNLAHKLCYFCNFLENLLHL